MKIKSFVFNSFYENTYLLISETKETYIVDPGCYEERERKELVSYIESNELNPIAILNTHCHIDHVLGNAFLADKYNIPLCIPEGEVEVLKSVEVYAPNWGIAGYQSKEPDKLLVISDSLQIGDDVLSIRLAPGHSPGHLMFMHEQNRTLIAGDVIFKESIGRTDLPGGDFDTLEQSIREQVYTLPDATTIYPGHGDVTTVLHEKTNNPFVKP